MQKLLCSHFIAACVLLSGCNSDDENTDAKVINSEQYIGTWVAQAYGEAMVVEKNRIFHYQYTSDYCQQTDSENGDDADLVANYWQLSTDQQTMRQNLSLFGINQRDPVYSKTLNLPDSCLQNLVKLKGDSDYYPDAARDFDLFWQTFSEYYPAFNKRNVDWDAQREQLSLNLHSDSSDESLFYALVEMIAPLEDSHVAVMAAGSDEGVNFTRGVTLQNRITQEYIEVNGSVDTEQEYLQYLNYFEEQINRVNQIRFSYATDSHQIKQAANDNLVWFTTPDNIGYLGIENMIFFSGDDLNELSLIDELNALQPAIQQAMSDLANTYGLIIDIRQNSGGFDGASQLIVRHFLDKQRHLYSKQARLGNGRTEPEDYWLEPLEITYQKPVVLLTSTMTTSAAEVFTLMMRELPHVTLVGEATQGALSDVLSKSLPNGFKIDLVNEYYLSPAGDWFEGEGIPVDSSAEFATQEQRQAGIDEGIERAIELLINAIE